MRKPVKVVKQVLRTGRRDTSSRSESMEAGDPRWRRNAQESGIAAVIARGLQYDRGGRLVTAPLTGVQAATEENVVATTNTIIRFLNKGR